MDSSVERNEEISASVVAENTSSESLKTCFVIMPIADMNGYETRHFDRVYSHIIKPACEKAGFSPIRADEVSSSNLIVLDILRRIVECDIAICDLSGRNPNVMYELGLRQAFNKKTVLIKDDKTISPFDVQAFRYCEYDISLRIDNAFNNISSIEKALKSTSAADESDVNSIVQLLKIQPAQVGEKTILSSTDTLILDAINDLNSRFNSLSDKQLSPQKIIKLMDGPTKTGESFLYQINTYKRDAYYKNSYFKAGEFLGDYVGMDKDPSGKLCHVFKNKNKLTFFEKESPDLEFITEDLDF
ncbi:hypothetical protein E3U32_10180 [Lelliottia nimipressuralis]|uniref:hypothetical protein n=1 Tax=Lelliottia nimipressuralis TaxID=69220 RepID=UPI001069BDA7|nr:hypothetical protein [Lelliottia nimipressuralis]TFB25517.1 hypothetical protein E3U32_10180 [Lelliottia nimipressuralis]